MRVACGFLDMDFGIHVEGSVEDVNYTVTSDADHGEPPGLMIGNDGLLRIMMLNDVDG